MNVDIRGVKRGACLECDCTEYMYISNEGIKCAYCCCAPAKHVKIEQSQDLTENFTTTVKDEIEILGKEISTEPIINIEEVKPSSEYSLEEICTEPIINIEEVKPSTEYSLQEAPSKTEVYMVVPSSYMDSISSTSSASSSFDTYASLLPEKLPRAIEMAMQQKKLTQNQQNVVVRSIADRCYAAGISGYEIDMVADLAVEKWSSLKSEYGPKSKSLAIQLKRRISKLKTPKSRKLSEGTESKDESHDSIINMMQEEMQKKCPSQMKLKHYLTTVRKTRMHLASQMRTADQLSIYPAFKSPDLLLWEFSQSTNVSEGELQRNWNCCVDAMSRYLEGTVNALPVYCVSYDMKTVHILTILPTLLKSGKRTNERTKFIIEIFEDGTPVNSILPMANEPPRLLSVGSKLNPDLSLTCYVNGMPLFISKAVKSVLLLIATYWVFDIKFPSECRPSFLFLSTVLLKHAFKSNELQKHSAVLSLLKQLDL